MMIDLGTLFYLIFWLAMAGFAYYVAGLKNRNQWLWGVLGFFFGIFTLIVLACLPKVDKQGTLTLSESDKLASYQNHKVNNVYTQEDEDPYKNEKL